MKRILLLVFFLAMLCAAAPDLFPEYTEQLVGYGFVHRTADGKYWVDGN